MLFNTNALALEVVQEIFVTRLEYIVPHHVDDIDARVTLGTIFLRPCAMRFFVINRLQDDYMTVEVITDDKPHGLACM